MGKNLVLSQNCHPFAAHFEQRRYLTKLIKSRAPKGARLLMFT